MPILYLYRTDLILPLTKFRYYETKTQTFKDRHNPAN